MHGKGRLRVRRLPPLYLPLPTMIARIGTDLSSSHPTMHRSLSNGNITLFIVKVRHSVYESVTSERSVKRPETFTESEFARPNAKLVSPLPRPSIPGKRNISDADTKTPVRNNSTRNEETERRLR